MQAPFFLQCCTLWYSFRQLQQSLLLLPNCARSSGRLPFKFGTVMQIMIPCTLRQLFRFPFFSLGGFSLLSLLLPCMVGIVPFDCKAFSFLFELFTSFSGHRPAQRECVRMGLRSHARCHPYPILQPVKVGHTTGVYDTDSFLIVTWVLLRPTRTNQ